MLPRNVVAPAGSDIELLGPVPAGQAWRIEHLSLSNDNSANTGNHFRIGRPGATVACTPRDVLSATAAVFDLVDLWMFPGDFLFAHPDTLTAGSVLTFSVFGWIYFTVED